MPAEALPQAEAATRAWTRANAAITAIVGQRITVGLPRDAAFPCIAIGRVGGTVDDVVPWDGPLMQFDCWAAPAVPPVEGIPNRGAAEHLATVLIAELHAIGAPQAAGPDAELLGAQVLGMTWRPESGPIVTPRFVVTALLHFRAA